MCRGFKTEANSIAREVRSEVGLAPASSLDVWRLIHVPERQASDVGHEAFPRAVASPSRGSCGRARLPLLGPGRRSKLVERSFVVPRGSGAHRRSAWLALGDGGSSLWCDAEN